MLEVKDLHAYYGKSHILQGVDIHIDAGEVVSFWDAMASGAPRRSKPSWARYHRTAR